MRLFRRTGASISPRRPQVKINRWSLANQKTDPGSASSSPCPPRPLPRRPVAAPREALRAQRRSERHALTKTPLPRPSSSHSSSLRTLRRDAPIPRRATSYLGGHAATRHREAWRVGWRTSQPHAGLFDDVHRGTTFKTGLLKVVHPVDNARRALSEATFGLWEAARGPLERCPPGGHHCESPKRAPNRADPASKCPDVASARAFSTLSTGWTTFGASRSSPVAYGCCLRWPRSSSESAILSLGMPGSDIVQDATTQQRQRLIVP
jgi:hypothetical protein